MNLSHAIVRRVVTAFVSVLVVALFLYAADVLRDQMRQVNIHWEFDKLPNRLDSEAAAAEVGVAKQLQDARTRVTAMARRPATMVRSRLTEIDNQLQAHASRVPIRERSTYQLLQLVRNGSVREEIELEARLELLLQERSYLETVLAALEYRSLAERVRQLELRRDEQYRLREAKRVASEKAAARLGYVERKVCAIHKTDNCRDYDAARNEYFAQIEAHSAAYLAWFQALAELRKRPGRADVEEFQPAVASVAASAKVIKEAVLAETPNRPEDNWLMKAWSAIKSPLASAAQVVAGVIALGVAVKLLFFFVLAPLASRRPPIRLQDSGKSLNWQPASSQTSLSIPVQRGEELLIKGQYLQDTSATAKGRTRLFLSWRYPLSSLASGMIGLTRMTSDTETHVTVSSTENPLDEISAIAIPPGTPLVLQPQHLVGVLQRTDAPVRISSSWQLTHLHAWLTLQFRYLLFHGPGTVYVKGCRGVRQERPTRGRRISQAATIGFTADVAYSNARTETFGAYLLGLKPLMNDSFSGATGFYLYQEIPRNEQRSSGLEGSIKGISDALLKAFGI